jgi:hypothetical protein
VGTLPARQRPLVLHKLIRDFKSEAGFRERKPITQRHLPVRGADDGLNGCGGGLGCALPKPLFNGPAVANGRRQLLRRVLQQAKDLDEIRLPGAVWPDQDVKVLQVNRCGLIAEGQEIPDCQAADDRFQRHV